jgi:hypothetical protein
LTSDTKQSQEPLKVVLGAVAELSEQDAVYLAVFGRVMGIQHIAPSFRKATNTLSEKLVILQIEDFTGKVDVIVSKDTVVRGGLPKDGSIISVLGCRLSSPESEPVVLIAYVLSCPALQLTPGVPQSPPPNTVHVVHLTLPFIPNEAEENRVLNGLKTVLTTYPGKTKVMLYFPLNAAVAGGEPDYQVLEVQDLGINYTPEFVSAVTQWIDPKSIRLEAK